MHQSSDQNHTLTPSIAQETHEEIQVSITHPQHECFEAQAKGGRKGIPLVLLLLSCAALAWPRT